MTTTTIEKTTAEKTTKTAGRASTTVASAREGHVNVNWRALRRLQMQSGELLKTSVKDTCKN